MRDGCVFCEYEGPSPILRDYGPAFVISPILPVIEGHVLVIPRVHVEDFTERPPVTGLVAAAAGRYVAELGLEHVNLITSKGVFATQSVKHLHMHLVPRAEGDGLRLPWDWRP